MKVRYTTKNGRMTVELEADTQIALFKQLAQFQEVFENTTCSNGRDSSDDVKFVVREDDDGNHYYELQCVDDSKPTLRYAKKRYGQHKGKEQTLFPKSEWVKWNPETKQEEPIRESRKQSNQPVGSTY